jgi:CPA2 family monovalent cation:H+ antiporter-2
MEPAGRQYRRLPSHRLTALSATSDIGPPRLRIPIGDSPGRLLHTATHSTIDAPTGFPPLPHADISQLISQLLIVLGAGLVAGIVCKRIGVSLLAGYLVVGALIGVGGFSLVPSRHEELELLAEAGALLLLFSVGIEFSLAELFKLSRFFFVGGSVQMLLVAVPLALITRLWGWSWPAAVLTGSAAALSSTVLVFRALNELGQTDSAHGRRGLGILLFQDVALVPLLILLPLVTGHGEPPSAARFAELGLVAALFVIGVWAAQRVVRRWIVPQLAEMKSVEIVVLFALSMVAGLGWLAAALKLPAAVGALAAGLVLSDNRLSHQMESILLPFRETFSAVFFVSLGMLLKPLSFIEEPFLLAAGLGGIVLLKTLAGGVALRCTGLRWRSSLGMGLGLAQLGEFSFLLAAQGMEFGLISAANYNRMLFIAIATLIATPQLIRIGLRRATGLGDEEEIAESDAELAEQLAVVIGIGPIGRQVTSRLEMMGLDVGLVDLSPLNLQPLAQLGFRTYQGDARDPQLLARIGITRCCLAVVCVPSDDIAMQVVRGLRNANRRLKIVVRCRFQAKVHELEAAGADGVISEEIEASQPIAALSERLLRSAML